MKSTAVMKPTVVVTAAGAPIDMAAALMERSPSRLPQGQSPLFPARPSDVMSCAQLRQKIQQALPPAQGTSMLECYRLLADGAVVADDALIDIALLRAPALGAVPDCTSPVTSGTMPCDDDLTATPPARANGRGGLAQSDSATPFTPPSSHTVATFPPCLPPVDGSSPRAGFAFARNEAEMGKHASHGSAGSDGCNTPSSAAEGHDLGRVSAMSAQCETSVPELELIALVHPVACTLGTVTVLRHPADAGDTPVDTDAALSRHPGFYNMVLRGVKDLPNLKARVKQRLRDEGIVQGDASPTSTAAVSAAGFNSESATNDAHDEDHTHGESRSPAPAQDTAKKAVDGGDLKVSATDIAPLHDLIRLSATLRRGLHTELLQVLKDVRADIAKAAAPAATAEDKVKQIHAAIPPAARDAVMAMGFPEAAVDRALLSNRMDPELAINFLLSVDVDAVSGPLQDFEIDEFSAAFLSDSAAADTAAAMEPGVAELAAMGFPPKDARRALKLSNGDPNAAGDLLLRGLPDEEPSALLLSTIAEVIKAEAEAFPRGTVTLPPLAGEEKENGLSAVSKSRVEGEVARIQDDDEAEDEDAQAPPAAATTEENSATAAAAASNEDGNDAAKKAEKEEESGSTKEQRQARAELAEDSGPLGDGANRLSPDIVERAMHYLQTIPNVAVVLRTHPKYKYALATLCSLLPRPRVAAPVLSQLRAMTQGSGASSTPTISLASASVLTSSGSRVRGLQTSSSAVRSPPPSMNVSAANSVAARQSQMQQAPQGALPPRQQSASLGRPSALSARSAGPVAPPSSRTLSANEASPSELHREEMRRQGHQAYSIAAGDSSPGPAAGVDAAAMQAALAALQAPHPASASASAPAAPTNASGESQNESPVPQQQQRASDAQGAAELYALLTATQESRAVEAGIARTAPTAAPPASSGLRPSGLAATSFQQQLSGTTTPALRQDTEQFGESTEALAGSEVQLPRGMLAGSRRQQSQSVPPPPPPHAGHQHVAQHMAGGFHGGLAGGSDDDDDDEDEDELVSHSSSV